MPAGQPRHYCELHSFDSQLGQPPAASANGTAFFAIFTEEADFSA